jgi:hypothetical protein
MSLLLPMDIGLMLALANASVGTTISWEELRLVATTICDALLDGSTIYWAAPYPLIK